MSKTMSITTAGSKEIDKDYMLHLHQELWRLREILEKHKIAYEENVWTD